MITSPLFLEFSNALGLPLLVAERIVRTAPLRYKQYVIPKRSGGSRVVAQPAREVKAFQYLILRKLENILPIHEASTAYRRGTSIIMNARQHVNSSYILKLDFNNFFPSITESDIRQHLSVYCADTLTPSDVKFVSRAVVWVRDRKPPRTLCIGAPTSPFLSNSILYEFDCAIAERMLSAGVHYTRYADDITFSAVDRTSLDEAEAVVREVLKALPYPKLSLNDRKTVRASKAGRRVVTGIVLTPDHKLSVGRDRKRLVRAMYHRYLLGKLEESEILRMRGLIAFIESVEPGYAQRLKLKSD